MSVILTTDQDATYFRGMILVCELSLSDSMDCTLGARLAEATLDTSGSAGSWLRTICGELPLSERKDTVIRVRKSYLAFVPEFLLP